MAVVKSYWSLIYTTVLPFGRIKIKYKHSLMAFWRYFVR